MEHLTLTITSPHGPIYQQSDVERVSVPTADGEITILPRHIPLVAALQPGEIVVHRDGATIPLAVSEGVLEIEGESKVHILADTAEHAEEIDVARAEAARKRAEELLAQQHDLEDVDFARIQAQIEKEMARLGVAKKYKA